MRPVTSTLPEAKAVIRVAVPNKGSLSEPAAEMLREADLIGRDVAYAFALSDTAPLELVREWGVRRLGEQLELRARAEN